MEDFKDLKDISKEDIEKIEKVINKARLRLAFIGFKFVV